MSSFAATLPPISSAQPGPTPSTPFAVELDFERRVDRRIDLDQAKVAIAEGRFVWIDVDVSDGAQARKTLAPLGLCADEFLDDALTAEPATEIWPLRLTTCTSSSPAAGSRAPTSISSVWATGLVATLPGFQPATIAVRNLEAGSSVRPDDVVVWPVIAADKHFSTPGELDDIVLTRSVARGLPITRPDVLRLQVVAARDIAAETLLERNGVSLAWSPYPVGCAAAH